MERMWLASLTSLERDKLNKLRIGNDREAFRIIHNWSKADPDTFDFKIVCESLAERLNVTVPTASAIRNRLCDSGILRKTAEYAPFKLAARYEWIANKEPKGKRLFNYRGMSRDAGGWEPPRLRLDGSSAYINYCDELPFQILPPEVRYPNNPALTGS